MSREKKADKLAQDIKRYASRFPSRTINELRVVLGMERVVARIEFDAVLSELLIFKGGFVLLKTFNSPRFTRDIDALVSGSTKKSLEKAFIHALERDLDDGFWFGDFKFEKIDLQDGYGGIRASFAFQIGDPPTEGSKVKKLSRLHLDLSFDAPPRNPKREVFTSILGAHAPFSWNIYPMDYIIAEKLEALFSRGSVNSRAKDIFDLNLLLPKITDEISLKSAIDHTFSKRPTPVPESFFKTASQFDLRILKGAWSSVEIDTDVEKFDQHWKQFMDLLKRFFG